jgi:hypothetical protein
MLMVQTIKIRAVSLCLSFDISSIRRVGMSRRSVKVASWMTKESGFCSLQVQEFLSSPKPWLSQSSGARVCLY